MGQFTGRLSKFHIRFDRPFGADIYYVLERPQEPGKSDQTCVVRNLSHLNDALKSVGKNPFLNFSPMAQKLNMFVDRLDRWYAAKAHRNFKGFFLLFSMGIKVFKTIGYILAQFYRLRWGNELKNLHQRLWDQRSVPDVEEYFFQPRDINWPLARKTLKTSMNTQVQDLPHDFAPFEWWYFNGSFESQEKKYSFFLIIYRRLVLVDPLGTPYHTAFATGTIVDENQKTFAPLNLFEPDFPLLQKKKLLQEKKLNRFYSRLRDYLAQGKTMVGDTLSSQKTYSARDRLCLINPEFYLESLPQSQETTVGVRNWGEHGHVQFTFSRPLSYCLNAADGIHQSQSAPGSYEEVLYYFRPKLACSVILGKDSAKQQQCEGSLWFDHEFQGSHYEKKNKKVEHPGWIWFSASTNTGRFITCYFIYESPTKVYEKGGYSISQDYTSQKINDLTIEILETWTSPATGIEYPVAVIVRGSNSDIDFKIQALFPEQEIITSIGKPAFWEGRVTLVNEKTGETGAGFFEVFNMHQWDPEEKLKLDDFFP